MLSGFLHSTIMITKNLIKALQALVDAHEPTITSTVGEHKIMIDIFVRTDNGYFKYAGFSPHIKLEKSDNGIYDIISAFSKV